jgi:subtilisin-like proprotein convertase family protein
MRFFFILLFLLFSFSSSAQTFSGIGDTIPDAGGPILFPITVSGLTPAALNSTHGLTHICINILHPYDGDLRVAVIAPDGTKIRLFNQLGGAGDHFTNTCFDSAASTSINAGSAPFTGVFRPSGNIGQVNNGQNGNGVWQIECEDVGAADTGKLVDWSIAFAANAPTPIDIKSDIPLVVVNTNGVDINKDFKILAQIKIIDNGNGNIHLITDSGNVYTGNAGIKIRGAYSSSLPQKPYSITTFGNTTSTDSNVSLLGMPAEHDWILQATYNDKSFVRNSMMYDIWRNMGYYGARSKYCELVLNGEYQGVYMIMEKIKRDPDRLDIPKLTTTDTAGDALTGGYIFKHDYGAQGWTSQFSAPNCTNRFYDYNYEYPKAGTLMPQQEKYIKKIVDRFEARLNSASFADTTIGYSQLIHHPSFIDYMLANEMAWNGDGYKKSMFFHKLKDSKDSTIHAGPIWDFDWALKRMPWTPVDHSGWYYKVDPCDGDVLFLPWWNRMMEDTLFVNEAKCRWQLHRKYALHLDSIYKYIDAQALYLKNAQKRHFEYWGILGGNSGTPEQSPFSQTFQEEIDTLKSIITHRIHWIDNNLGGQCYNALFPLHVNTSAMDAIAIYPNPATNAIVIKTNFIPSAINIMDVSGASVLSIRPNKSMVQHVSIEQLAGGMYFVQVKNNNKISMHKLHKL